LECYILPSLERDFGISKSTASLSSDGGCKGAEPPLKSLDFSHSSAKKFSRFSEFSDSIFVFRFCELYSSDCETPFLLYWISRLWWSDCESYFLLHFRLQIVKIIFDSRLWRSDSFRLWFSIFKLCERQIVKIIFLQIVNLIFFQIVKIIFLQIVSPIFSYIFDSIVLQIVKWDYECWETLNEHFFTIRSRRLMFTKNLFPHLASLGALGLLGHSWAFTFVSGISNMNWTTFVQSSVTEKPRTLSVATFFLLPPPSRADAIVTVETESLQRFF